MAAKRKQWAADSMEGACNAVKNEQMGLREAARKYNAPINVLPHPPPCGQTLGIGGDLPTFKDIASPLGQITKVKLHLIPSYCIWGYVGFASQ